MITNKENFELRIRDLRVPELQFENIDKTSLRVYRDMELLKEPVVSPPIIHLWYPVSPLKSANITITFVSR